MDLIRRAVPSRAVPSRAVQCIVYCVLCAANTMKSNPKPGKFNQHFYVFVLIRKLHDKYTLFALAMVREFTTKYVLMRTFLWCTLFSTTKVYLGQRNANIECGTWWWFTSFDIYQWFCASFCLLDCVRGVGVGCVCLDDCLAGKLKKMCFHLWINFFMDATCNYRC